MFENIYNATVVFRNDVGTQTAVLRVKPDAGPVPEFSPGQFVTIGLPAEGGAEGPEELIRRPYSIASPANERDHVELYFSRAANGELTSRLWQMQVGARVWMDERIKGTFTLDDVPRGIDLLFVSTGTGVAPFVSMLRSYRGSGRWGRLVLANGARTSTDQGYHAELESISREDPSITYLPTVSQDPESSNWRGLRGRVQEALADVLDAPAGGTIDPKRCHAFVCGNPDMIESVSGMLVDRGFSVDTKQSRGNLHFEKYWA